MVRSVLAGFYAFLIAAITSALIVMAPGSADSADPQPICTVDVLGENLLDVDCTLNGSPIPDSQVNVGAVVGNTLTVQVQSQTVSVPVPGPTKTVTQTVRPPQATATVTETVTVSQPQSTVTAREPQATATVTETFYPATGTPTQKPSKPQATATVTATTRITIPAKPDQSPSSTGQDATESGKVSPEPFFRFDLDPNDDSVSAAEAGLGALSLLGLMGLMLLALYAGYVLGYKDSERKEINFMRALRDQLMIR